jgi:4a-hydroxytetrahydrobiopterin dehydratase
MKAPPERLSSDAIAASLEELPGWQVKDAKLHREYRFEDFVTAFGWMSACALVAEKRGHHPEWSNVWSRVTVDLTTHESGGITERDVALARRFEELAQRFGAR